MRVGVFGYFALEGARYGEETRRLKALEKGNLRLRKAVSDLTLDAMILIVGGAAGGSRESDLRPSRRRLAVDHVREVLGVSERRACRVLGQNRSTQRRPRSSREDEARLTADIIRLAEQYGRYGYRRITALLRREGWTVNAKRVEWLPGASHPADAGGVTS